MKVGYNAKTRKILAKKPKLKDVKSTTQTHKSIKIVLKH